MSHWVGNLQQSTLQGTNNITLAYCAMVQPNVSPAIIMVSGRSESYLKYQSLINEFYELGYSVYMQDHRGQGLSQRLLADPHKGHVDKFSDYVDDLTMFINSVVTVGQHSNHLILSHSMGGAIATRYLQTKHNIIDKLILASPMYGIVLPVPALIAASMISIATSLDSLLKREPSFVSGGTGYKEVAFEDNELTQDPIRYADFKKEYQNNPKIQLGSPTYQWLQVSLDAGKKCIDDADKIIIPTLLMQAEADTIVDNKAQDSFVVNAHQEYLTTVHYANARHELFFEIDEIRTQVMTQVRQFLEN